MNEEQNKAGQITARGLIPELEPKHVYAGALIATGAAYLSKMATPTLDDAERVAAWAAAKYRDYRG